jgi:hypothetical protein
LLVSGGLWEAPTLVRPTPAAKGALVDAGAFRVCVTFDIRSNP